MDLGVCVRVCVRVCVCVYVKYIYTIATTLVLKYSNSFKDISVVINISSTFELCREADKSGLRMWTEAVSGDIGFKQCFPSSVN